jgi:hypothetical protein
MTKAIVTSLLVSIATLHASAQDAALDQLVQQIDARIYKVTGALDLLAAAPTVQSGDWDAMKSLLAAVQADGPPGTYWFAWPNGTYCTVEKGLTGQTLSDRAYFPVLMSGKNVIGDLVVSKSTGKKAIVLAVPVSLESRVIGAVGASLFAEEFSAALAVPEVATFFALNAEGKAAIHSDPTKLFEDVSAEDAETVVSPLTGWRVGIRH